MALPLAPVTTAAKKASVSPLQKQPGVPPALLAKVDKRLSKLKLELMMRPNTIFYTTLLFSLKMKITDSIGTAGVDGYTMYINPQFFMSITESEQVGLIIHEVMHLALNHITRGKGKDHVVFNRAADHVINLCLLEYGYDIPSCGLSDKKYENKSTEEVYDILIKEKQKNPPKPGMHTVGGIGADILPSPKGKTTHEVEDHVTDMVLKAANQARTSSGGCGNIPGGVELMLDEVLNPKMPWEMILQNYLNDFCKDDFSMSRPNRRFLPDFYLPGAYGQCIKNMTIAIDVSGSVSKNEFSYFISEIKAIQQKMKPEKLTLISFDTKIQNIHVAHEATNLFTDLKFTGGGGTRPRPVIEWLNENRPEVCLFFTDGCFSVPEVKPVCPIIWVINDNSDFTCDYGEIIHYDIVRKS